MSEFQAPGLSRFLEEAFFEEMHIAVRIANAPLQQLITFNRAQKVAMTLGRIWLHVALGATTKKVTAHWLKWVGP